MKYIFHIKNEGGPAKDIDIQFTLVGYNISSYGSYNINQLQIDSCELLIIYYEEITGTCERVKNIFKKNKNGEMILVEAE